MTVTVSKLRQDICQLLDRVIKTGQPLEVSCKGQRLKIVQYLHELGRVSDGPALIVKELEKTTGLAVKAGDFERTVLAALTFSWTRDPFDRILVAQAHLNTAALLSKAELIRKRYRRAFWN